MTDLRIVEPEDLVILLATNKSIAAATHLTDMDSGAVEALRDVARTIDVANLGLNEEKDDAPPEKRGRGRPKGSGVGGQDNVYVTYLKFCEQLGLTPAGRVKLGDTKQPVTTSKLAHLRSINGAKAKA